MGPTSADYDDGGLLRLGCIRRGSMPVPSPELPDYESGAYLGPKLGVFDINDISFLADLCDKLGFDCTEGAALGCR